MDLRDEKWKINHSVPPICITDRKGPKKRGTRLQYSKNSMKNYIYLHVVHIVKSSFREYSVVYTECVPFRVQCTPKLQSLWTEENFTCNRNPYLYVHIKYNTNTTSNTMVCGECITKLII